MSENQIVTISEADVKTGGQLGSRTQYLADLARRHPHRDEYGQLLEFTVAVPDGPHEFRGRRGTFPIRAAAESAAVDFHGARVIASPLVTAKRRTVMIVPARDCRPPKTGEPNYCAKHCSGPACFTQKLYPCCGLCTMHRAKGNGA